MSIIRGTYLALFPSFATETQRSQRRYNAFKILDIRGEILMNSASRHSNGRYKK